MIKEKLTGEYKPNRMIKFVVCIFTAVALLICALTYLQYVTKKSVDISQYDIGGDEYHHQIEQIYRGESGEIRITGFAFKAGEDIETVDVAVIVKDTSTEETYELRTGCFSREDISQLMDDGCDYSMSGFQAVTGKKELNGTYRIYIMFRNNDSECLLDTGTEFNTNEI
ncbi:MAG: hypothetical protein K6E13_03930 [Lachnospiraceae bacterium]|nr:hypothetical protein [Lachnospiraceae bacterium]